MYHNNMIMIEIEIPKDIRKYESKLVGPLTTRQTICAVITCATAFCIYKVTAFLPSDFRFILVGICVTPFLLLGWVKPYGMKFEQFVSTAFVSTIISPKHRKYKTINAYAPEINKDDKSKKKKKKKINKEYLPYK